MATECGHTQAYFDALIKVLETPDKMHSFKGGVRKAGLVTAGVVGSSVTLGPLGALLGGVVAGGRSREMKAQGKTIKKMAKRLRATTPNQRQQLVDEVEFMVDSADIEFMVDSADIDKLLEFVKAGNRKRVINLVKNFMVDELEYQFKKDTLRTRESLENGSPPVQRPQKERKRSVSESLTSSSNLLLTSSQDEPDIKPPIRPRKTKAKSVHFALDLPDMLASANDSTPLEQPMTSHTAATTPGDQLPHAVIAPRDVIARFSSRPPDAPFHEVRPSGATRNAPVPYTRRVTSEHQRPPANQLPVEIEPRRSLHSRYVPPEPDLTPAQLRRMLTGMNITNLADEHMNTRLQNSETETKTQSAGERLDTRLKTQQEAAYETMTLQPQLTRSSDICESVGCDVASLRASFLTSPPCALTLYEDIDDYLPMDKGLQSKIDQKRCKNRTPKT